MTPIQAWADLVTVLRGLPDWQALVIIVVGSLTVAIAIQVVGDVLIKRLTARIHGEIDDIVLTALHPPLYVSAILVGVYLARDALPLGEALSFGIEAGVLSVLTLVWGFTFVTIGRRVSRELISDSDRQNSTIPIFQNVWSALVIGVGTYLLLTFWAVDVTPLLASAGILGIIIGFAAKDTIANLFGSVALFFDGTYEVGDYIVLESGERGRVEDISMRSTVIRTRDDVRVTIPNAKLNSAVLTNESSPSTRYRVRSSVGVAYGSDLDHVESTLLAAADRVPDLLDHPEPRVRFRSFGESALDLDLLAWIRRPADRGRATHRLNRAVYEALVEAGITIPYPQRDVHLRTEAVSGVPGTEPPSPGDD